MIRKIPITVLAFVAFLMPATGRSGNLVVVRNATILTVSHGVIQNGSILVRGGKIAEVGGNIPVPPGAAVIDASGQFVMPGIIDAHSHIACDIFHETTLPVTSMVAVGDAINPKEISIYRELASGITTVNVAHGSADPVGGQDATIKLRWGKTAKELLFAGAKPGLKMALGENSKSAADPPPAGVPGRYARYPLQTRMGVEAVIRQAFTEARQYMKEWDEYRRQAAAGQRNVLPPHADLKLEPLAEVLRGERLVHVHCYRGDEILMVLRLADDFNFKIATLIHAAEGYKVAREIAAHQAGATIFADRWAYKFEAWDGIPYNAAIMATKGVLVSLNTDRVPSEGGGGWLVRDAAKMLKYGNFSEEEALRLITLNPAKQLRIDKYAGSIDVGKDADLAIFDKHPLSNYAKVTKVLIDGEVYFDREQDLKNHELLAREVKDLIEKERKTAPRRPAAAPAAPRGDADPESQTPARHNKTGEVLP